MRNANRGLTIRIGEINLGFYADAAIFDWGIVQRQYRNFIVQSEPDIIINIKKSSVVPPGTKNILLGSHNWTLGREQGRWIIHFYQKDFSASVAIIKPSFKEVEYFTSNNDLIPVMYNLPKFIFILAQQKFEQFVVHACGVADDKRGYLFVADSGGGKSTIARLAQSRTILNDDRIILRKKKNKFKIFGTPWAGLMNMTSNRGAEIKDIFFLKKSKTNQIISLNRIEAAKILFRNIVFFPLNETDINNAFRLCYEITYKLRCCQLRFKPEAAIWEKLDKFH